jgi:hypothetical protein
MAVIKAETHIALGCEHTINDPKNRPEIQKHENVRECSVLETEAKI